MTRAPAPEVPACPGEAAWGASAAAAGAPSGRRPAIILSAASFMIFWSSSAGRVGVNRRAALGTRRTSFASPVMMETVAVIPGRSFSPGLSTSTIVV